MSEQNLTYDEKKLGKIQELHIGMGGYQDAMFGVTITLSGAGWGVSTFRGAWSPSQIKHDEHTQWSEEDRLRRLTDAFVWLDQLMTEAKVTDVRKLIGKPIEAIFNGNTLKSWRILTEVL